MKFDLFIEHEELTIYCLYGLENFAREFIKYYDEHIEDIKNKLGIKEDVKLIVALTDDEKQAGFVYDKSDFSGFFNDTGAFAYINPNGKRSKESIFKGLMHELTHHLYKYYVYGKDKKRITWVDEGIAQLFSNQKDYLNNNDVYNTFLTENLSKNKDLDLNKLNHDDKSFGYNNGYNLSYIAIRYLYETNDFETFISIIGNYGILIQKGETILNDVYDYYDIKGLTKIN